MEWQVMAHLVYMNVSIESILSFKNVNRGWGYMNRVQNMLGELKRDMAFVSL